jgi:hypothetical protein
MSIVIALASCESSVANLYIDISRKQEKYSIYGNPTGVGLTGFLGPSVTTSGNSLGLPATGRTRA